MHSIWRRGFALYLCLVVCLSLLPTSAFAEEGIAEEATDPVILNDSEVSQEGEPPLEGEVAAQLPEGSEPVDPEVPENAEDPTDPVLPSDSEGAQAADPVDEDAFIDQQSLVDVELNSEDSLNQDDGGGYYDEDLDVWIDAYGECGADGDNLIWKLDEHGTLRIRGTGAMKDYYGPNESPWLPYTESITYAIIGNGVTTIGGRSFAYCSNLEGIAIPEGVTYIGDNAFLHCEKLTTILLPSSLTSIGNPSLSSAFVGCNSLESINVAPGNTEYSSLDGVLFDRAQKSLLLCPQAKSGIYSIPSGVWEIREWAFSGCSKLTSITIPQSVRRFCAWACYGCDNLCNFVVEESNPSFSTIDGILFDKSKTTLVRFPGARGGRYSIPDGVSEIGFDAFGGCMKLESIEIPDSVVRIGADAFEYCNGLTSIVIPSSVTCIDSNAFLGCESLQSISIPDSVIEIGWAVFSGCDSLADVYYGSSEARKAELTGNGWSTEYNDPFFNATWHYEEEELSCPSLAELTTLDYLAFSKIAYSSFASSDMEKPIREIVGSSWNDIWTSDISYGELYAHISGWKLFYISNSGTYNGFYAAAFRNGQNEAVLAYRGSESAANQLSDVDAFHDWFENDYPFIIGNMTGTQFDDAVQAYSDVSAIVGGENLVTTGHSLGGAWGSVISAMSGCRGVTFNAVPALDAIYSENYRQMAPGFRGVDRWNFTDQVNSLDFIAGTYEVFTFNRMKPYKAYQGRLELPHALESLVSRDSDGNVVMMPSGGSFHPTNAVNNYLLTKKSSIDLGCSSNETIKGGLASNFPRISYGGDGFDTIISGVWGDVLIGGLHNDEIDGRRGDDTYVYFKGDGIDTIRDIAGHDTLKLYGFSGGDEISIVDDEAAGYIFVECNGVTIIKIVNTHRDTWSNRFTIEVERDGAVTTHDITRYFSTRTYGRYLLIACPVSVDIIDENGVVVYSLDCTKAGSYYTEYGNFYVYEEEDGSYGKVLDLVDGYSVRILGESEGTMDFTCQNIVNGELSEEKTMENIATDETFEVLLAEDEDGDVFLWQPEDTNGDGTVNAEDQIHQWIFDSFDWDTAKASGWTTVSANYTCTKDIGHTKSILIDLTREELPDQTIYHASINAEDSLDGQSHSDSYSAVLPQLVTAHFASLTLDGTIGINYLVSMTDSVLANENARAVFVYKDVEYPRVIQGMEPDERGFYTFTFYIPAAEFANTVSLKFMDGEEVIPFEYDGKRLTNDTMKYSGQRYSKALSADSPARPLIDMLHNYCYNAYLGLEKKEPDVLPSTIATNPDISTVVAADMKPYKNSLTGSVTGLTINAISLNLESTTEINLRFTPAEGRSIEEFRFEVNGRNMTLQPVSGGSYMLTIENIAAKDLDTMYTVKVSSGSEEMEIQTSALAYCYTVLKKGLLSTDMQNTCKALYLYNQAANDYFHG